MAKPTDRELTPREVEALQLAANGNPSKRIAAMWGKNAPEVVRRHWQHAARKLGAENLAQAVAIAIREGLIQ